MWQGTNCGCARGGRCRRSSHPWHRGSRDFRCRAWRYKGSSRLRCRDSFLLRPRRDCLFPLESKGFSPRLEFFAERGANWLNPAGIHTLRTPSDKQTKDYLDTVQALSRIEKEFKVDNAIVMRRREDSSFEYVAVGYNSFRGSSQSSPGAANPCSPAAAKNPCSTVTPKNPCSPATSENPSSAKGSRAIFDIGSPVHIPSLFPDKRLFRRIGRCLTKARVEV